MKRTCPPPANWRSIQVGDRIRFQSEGMSVEVEDTVQLRHNGMLITQGGREILPEDYVVRVSVPDRLLLPPGGNTPSRAGTARPCREPQGSGHAAPRRRSRRSATAPLAASKSRSPTGTETGPDSSAALAEPGSARAGEAHG